jgi:alpha-tubulin suppressor-like RCC1 family protein
LLACILYPGASFSAGDEARVADVAVGWGQSCVLRDNGRVWCWGAAILNGQESETKVPTLVEGLREIRSISAGRLASCAIDFSGTAACWGLNFQQSLERSEKIISPKPFSIQGLPPVKHISIGSVHMCALTIDGGVYCWGENPVGELGDGTNNARAQPSRVQGITKAVSLDTGVNNTCVVEASGSVKCWGTDNPGGGGGGGFAINSKVPKKIHGLKDMESVANGRNYVCGIQSGGQLLCWGSPAAVPRTQNKIAGRVIATDVGVFNGCAVYDDGRMTCWDFRDREPRTVDGLDDVQKVSLDGDRGCALLNDGSVRCWGKNILDHRDVSLPQS